MAVDGKNAKPNFVLARRKRVHSYEESFWIVGAQRHVASIDAFAVRVDDDERREAGLELLVKPELDLRGWLKNLGSPRRNRFDQRGMG
jgi:hypothetical protein